MSEGGDVQSPPYITGDGRDLRIDLLRGYFVIAMVVDHVRGASPLWLLTGGNRFFTGAAEGFILTSGLVAGLVYGRLVPRDGMGRSFVRVLTRALSLYLLTLALTFVFLPLSELLYLPWAQGVDVSSPVSMVVSILTLHQTYYLVDVMLLYTVLFFVTPLALALIDQGKRWWVLGGSWLLWGVFQIWPTFSALPWPIAGNYLFSFSAWQAIFFTGLVFGYGRKTMPIPRKRPALMVWAASGVVLALLIGLFFVVEPPVSATPASVAVSSQAGPDLRARVGDLFLNKVDERPGRVLSAGVAFTFLFLTSTVFWKPVRKVLGWLFLPLGQHALYAYTAHVGIVVVVALALKPFKIPDPGPQWLNGLIQVAAVGLIWVLVRYSVLAPTKRSMRYYYAVPALLAVLAGVAFFADPSPAYPGMSSADAVAAVPRTNRFGTPLPPDAGKVKPTATPGAPLPGAAATPVPTPTPTPELKPADTSLALQRVAPWVGTIRGTLEEHWFYTGVLDREMPYWAYLPPDYDTAGRRYPVVYLLHGLGGHRDEWVDYGIVSAADREMSGGAIAPMILIMPQGDTGFWVNNVDGGPLWGDYVTQDVVAQVDSTFRTLREPKARAIGGLSMGGYGAIMLAFTHPDVFGVVGAHGASIPAEGEQAILGTGSDFAQRDPVVLAGSLPGLDGLSIWIDMDAQDPWLSRAQELHDALTARGIDHTWQVLPGSHDWQYWTSHVVDYLHYYAGALTRQ